eukprot:TRINITY_DN10189_c0_g1_i1.p1 TRINITY_DN10189_c0_g1~~TRINITY_DN10189_c0_g1_i1.p1  ORF type:complete len:774 (-),score=162.54 TRINITY_DN10189_c0_g1_i1:268-2589(-)
MPAPPVDMKSHSEGFKGFSTATATTTQSNPEGMTRCAGSALFSASASPTDKDLNGSAPDEQEADGPALHEVFFSTDKAASSLASWKAAIADDWRQLAHAPPKLKADKELITSVMRTAGLALMYADVELRADKSVAMEAVSQNGGALAFVSKELCDDRELVTKAVSTSGLALQYAAAPLRGDRRIAIEAVAHSGLALQYVAKELQNDRDLVLTAVRQHRDALEFAPESLRADSGLVLEALNLSAAVAVDPEDFTDLELKRYVECHGSPLRHASKQLRSNRSIVSKAVQKDGSALLFTDSFAGDQAIVLEAVKTTGWALLFSSGELRSNKALVLEALNADGIALRFASKELQSDKEMAVRAVQRNGNALKYVSPALTSDLEVVMAAVRQQGKALRYVAPELCTNANLVLEAVHQNTQAYKHVCGSMKTSRELALKVAGMAGLMLADMLPEFRGDRGIVYEAVKQDGRALAYAAVRLRKDEAIAFCAVQQNGRALQFVAEDLRTSRQICLEAVGSSAEAYSWIDKRLFIDPNFTLSCIKRNPQVARYIAEELQVPLPALVLLAEEARNRFDKQLVLGLIRRHGWTCLQLAGPELRADEEIVRTSVKQSWEALQYCKTFNLAVMLEAVRQNWRAAEMLGAITEAERSLLAMANPEIIKVLEFGDTRAAVLVAVNIDGLLVRHASAWLRKDREVVAAACRNNPAALRYALGVARVEVEREMQDMAKEGDMTAAQASSGSTTNQATVLPWTGEQGVQYDTGLFGLVCCSSKNDGDLWRV